MQPLRHRPIRQQLTFVVLLTSSIALLLACAALFVLQFFTIKRNFNRQLAVITEIAASNAAAAAMFDDAAEASRTLAGLKVMPQIVSASVRLNGGKRLAHYGLQDDALEEKAMHWPAGTRYVGNRVVVTQPIIREKVGQGTLILQADFQEEYNNLLWLDGGIFVLVLATSLLLAFCLSSRFQSFITDPILRLASTAQRIAEDKDFSVRAEKKGGEEVRLLTEAFNQMLAQIQSQDGVLQTTQRELRKKVRALQFENAERKRAEAAQARLSAILEATPDIVSSANMTGRMLYLNRAAREMLGLDQHADISSITLSDFHPGWAARIVSTEGLPGAIHSGSWAGETAVRRRDGSEVHVSQVIIAHKSPTGAVEYFSTVMRDMTERRQAEELLRISQQKLLETSRLAGMAEVATGVLHNVGNVLNSVNVSAGLVAEKVRRSKASKLGKAAALLSEHKGDIADYVSHDPNGQKLPGYLAKLGDFLVVENSEILGELDQLVRNIEHIKEVVAMQQTYARLSGVFEDLPAERLVEDAISMNLRAMERHGITFEREFSPVPLVRVDRHKVLQILINLIRNAKYALDESERHDKRMTLAVSQSEEFSVRVVVADNGIGISPENLTRIFGHGFTTRVDGHGFGLHSGALAAREMGGSLTAASDGIGKGATFTLKLPVAATPSLP